MDAQGPRIFLKESEDTQAHPKSMSFFVIELSCDSWSTFQIQFLDLQGDVNPILKDCLEDHTR